MPRVVFPKLIVHATLAALYGAVVVALLLVLFNPAAARTDQAALAATLILVVAAYAVAAGVAWAGAYAALRYFARHPLRLPWFGLKYVVGFHVVNMTVVLVSGWVTLSRYRRVLAPDQADRVGFALAVLSLAWIAAVVATAVPRLRRLPWTQGAAAALALVALVAGARALPAAAGEPAEIEREFTGRRGTGPARRLVMLNFDGGDLDTVLTLQAQGKLPAFARLIEEGAYGRLRSLVPCETAVTRTTLVTGKMPHRHGVRSGVSRRARGLGPWIDIVPVGLSFDALLAPVLERRRGSLGDRGSYALWEIVAISGGRGAAAGWDSDGDDPSAGRRREGRAGVPVWAARLVDAAAVRQGRGGAGAALVAEIETAAAEDEPLMAAVGRLTSETRGGAVALSFPGLDRVAHAFLRFARPREFGDVSEAEIDLYGRVLEGYYRRIDDLIRDVLEAADDRTILLVTSSHGIEPVPLGDRLKGSGASGPSGTHRNGPDGFFFMLGPGVARGQRIAKASIADAAPTALYALGLPVARDFDGSILSAAFTPDYTFAHPVTVISTYE